MIEQESLFPKVPAWSKEWVGMPEFNVNDFEVFKEIRVKFMTAADFKAFMELIHQPMTMKTISIYFPPVQQRSRKAWRYVNTDAENENGNADGQAPVRPESDCNDGSGQAGAADESTGEEEA